MFLTTDAGLAQKMAKLTTQAEHAKYVYWPLSSCMNSHDQTALERKGFEVFWFS